MQKAVPFSQHVQQKDLGGGSTYRPDARIPRARQRIRHLEVGQPELGLLLQPEGRHARLRGAVRHLLLDVIHEGHVHRAVDLAVSLDFMAEPL